jgi:hypothetical protein
VLILKEWTMDASAWRKENSQRRKLFHLAAGNANLRDIPTSCVNF